MNQNEIRTNENKGFSLVELIVVIAIMAVMAAVLAPSLLAYVEKSRAQKDDSAMGEVTNAIQLAMSDQEVFDEVLTLSISNNASCYADGDTSTNVEDNKEYTKGTKADSDAQWLYNDKARIKDETTYTLAGSMRGVTVTFTPDAKGSKKTVFTIANAKINASKEGSETIGGAITKAGVTAGEGYLYNKVRSAIGDSVTLTSQTYRNSDYTVFIRMGSTGGKQASAQDAIKVYGQWNGTNIPKS